LHSSQAPFLARSSTDKLQDDGQHFRGYSSGRSLNAVKVDQGATPVMAWFSNLFIDKFVSASSSMRSFC
jgi:hypothetical protein